MTETEHVETRPLECPFCGGIDLDLPAPGQAYIECLGCGALGPDPIQPDAGTEEDWERTRERIITRWNTRA